MINLSQLHPFGVGTWGIAGYLHFDESVDTDKQLYALLHMHSKGINYLDCSLKYADGETLKVLAKFVEQVGRDNLFISAKLESFIEKPEDIQDQINTYKEILHTDYLDQVQLHAPSFTRLPITEAYRELAKFVENGQVRYLGASNFNVAQLEEAMQGCELDLLTHESLFNFSFRQNEDVGILNHCHERKIKFIAYQPLHRTKTENSNFELLVNLSKKYNVSQSQIILNWLVRKGIMPLIRSDNPSHIDEDIAALTFTLEDLDYKAIDDFRIPEIVDAPVDWSDSGLGTPIYFLANKF
jgi:diketogulonate reductase-like aldo/keto reductase